MHLSFLQASLLRSGRRGRVGLGGLGQGAQGEMGIAHTFKDSDF